MLQHYNWGVLVIFVVAIYVLWKAVFKRLQNNNLTSFLNLLDISAYSIITLMLFLLNQYLWKYPIINPLIIDVPVVEGHYEGKVYIRYVSDSVKVDTSLVDVDIEQTATSCNMVLKSKHGSITKSLVAGFEKTGGVWTLSSVYHNENLNNPNNRNEYYGASRVDIDKDAKGNTLLRGKWFNDVTRKSYGTIEITRTSN